MEYVSQPVLIGGFIQGAKRKNRKVHEETGEPLGSENYESVSFIDEETGRAQQLDLDAMVNGTRPKQGSRSRLKVVAFPRRVKKSRQDGSLYDSSAFDMRVTGFEAAAA